MDIGDRKKEDTTKKTKISTKSENQQQGYSSKSKIKMDSPKLAHEKFAAAGVLSNDKPQELKGKVPTHESKDTKERIKAPRNVRVQGSQGGQGQASKDEGKGDIKPAKGKEHTR
ncbi:Dynein heavy chain family protein [Corchorus olitorius]|uniref:Dynein heavy chain family protein n=1 Tax=Corchorus olitorius TaxID=93759 RepID=A0A1R3J2N2_9ROSI|nr:Dynein heavy chain family protein [Corchorus olitorius]